MSDSLNNSFSHDLLMQSFECFKASGIVNAQDVKQGSFPAGAYASSNKITPDYFSESAESHRSNQIKKGMYFLHTLIHRKLALGMKKIDLVEYTDHDIDLFETRPTRPTTTSATQMAPKPNDTNEEDHIVGGLDEPTVLSLENLVFVQPTPTGAAAHKLETVSFVVSSVLKFDLSVIILRSYDAGLIV